jgi:GGDEF domain-containing protein
VLSVIHPFPLASWLSLLAGSLVYVLISYSLFGLSRSMALTSGLAFGVFLVTSLLGNMVARQIGDLRDLFQREQGLLDDLVQYDQSTGILRWKYAHQRMKAEVLRSVRYKKDLSLVLIQLLLPETADISEQELTNLYGQIVEVVLNSLRKDIDIPFIGEKIGIILPETTAEGAQILSLRLVDKIFRKVRAEVVIGIASVPDDAVTEEALLSQAEMALKFAVSSDQSVVPAARLRSALAEEKNRPAEEEMPAVGSAEPLEAALGPGEWRVEVENFTSMDDLPRVEKLFTESGAAAEFHLVRLDGTILVARVTPTEPNLPGSLRTLPQFVVKQADESARSLKIEIKLD